mmetsp:Transcript_24419/g.31832  ORF Transcript_24419/g.31832 Transcript_24419/m.31832 type:complete len:355 (+) Transcript_24419:140-1204(+)|eukprot:CAMPEP_0195270834 /NCGR_PEP_ID=MMETSP0706-20130129/14621_1 /TAXON_ID=33640 /ORGANISM="Asterionellopsis glacialis, Strain CCMP134" /LENGTH=354 /DNA_ID=CAMNT_0040326251 /DNA_START=40 /DNA_END=1104 /DNA_ORIENTATION=+
MKSSTRVNRILKSEISSKKPTVTDVTKPCHDVTEYDVLCGYGDKTIDHPGNSFLAALVADHSLLYHEQNFHGKQHLAQHLLSLVHLRGGQLLEKHIADQHHHTVGDAQALDMISQMMQNYSMKTSLSQQSDLICPSLPSVTHNFISMVTANAHSVPTTKVQWNAPRPEEIIPYQKPQEANQVILKAALEYISLAISSTHAFGGTAYRDDECTIDQNVGSSTMIAVKENKHIKIKEGTITNLDVLCGGGERSNRHEGNVLYRSILRQHLALYEHSEKGEKCRIVKILVNAVRIFGGRFLRKLPPPLSTVHPRGMKKTHPVFSLWYEIGNENARNKTSQKLRDMKRVSQPYKINHT